MYTNLYSKIKSESCISGQDKEFRKSFDMEMNTYVSYIVIMRIGPDRTNVLQVMQAFTVQTSSYLHL